MSSLLISAELSGKLANVTIGLVGIGGHMLAMEPAAFIAQEDWQYVDSVMDFHYSSGDDMCQQGPAIALLVQMVQQEGIQGFVGPCCPETSIPFSYLASAWNIPVVGYMSKDRELSNKFLHSTHMRTVSTTDMIGSLLHKLLAFYKWTKVTTLYISSKVEFHDVDHVVQDYSGSRNISITTVKILPDSPIEEWKTS